MKFFQQKSFTEEECIEVYNKLKSHASISIKKKKYNTALQDIITAANWAYTFNFIYSDKQIDDLILNIGRQWLRPFTIKKTSVLRYLFIDSHGIDNRGLTQQYIRGLMKMNVEFLFISMDASIEQQRDIRKELATYSKATTLFLNGKEPPKKRLLRAAKMIEEYQPQIALGHIFPWDPLPFMLFDAAKGITIYNINFTDHAFWIGSSIIDYNIEFRDYGMSVSLDRRGLKKEQLINLPYYPIKPLHEPFQGFPTLPKNAVIIFSGGSFYKMMGENDMYFKMCDYLLDIPQTVLIIAGSGNDVLLRNKISTMRNTKKVYVIGDRRDINEVFKHCDLYLNTYPLLGGLMSQYAVANAKPLLTLGSTINQEFSKVEGLVNHFNNNVKTFHNLEELIEYARHCISDPKFRQAEGLKNKKGLITEEKFNEILYQQLLGKHIDYFHWNKRYIDYQSITKIYLDAENNYNRQALKNLARSLHLKIFTIFPQYTMYMIPIVYNYILKRLKKRHNTSNRAK